MPLEADNEEGSSHSDHIPGHGTGFGEHRGEVAGSEAGGSLKSRWGMKLCRKQDFLSVIGVLSHACEAIMAGRSFLRRLIDLSTTVRRLDWKVCLNTSARSYIE